MRLAQLVPTLALAACGSATAKFQLSNDTPVARAAGGDVLADGTSLRLKIIAVYLAEDVDPVTMNNVGQNTMVWLNPECADDISNCNVDGMTLPVGPRVTQYFDLARPTAEVDAELDSQDLPVELGTYRYARVELCKAYGGQTQATVPTMMWAGPGIAAEVPFTSGDCGRTSQPFATPMVIAAGDAVEVTLGYDLSKAIVSGAPDAQGCGIAGYTEPDGSSHCFRACADLDATHRACMDFPDFTPSATKL